MMPVLDIEVTHRLGAFMLSARFASDGRVTALFGRSGAGKTSLINLIAGLARPDSGRIAVDGQWLVDTSRGLCLPMHRRRIGYVFQEARLFPHLTVRQNLLFGRWFARRHGEGGSSLADVVDLLGIAPLLDRRPEALSGGEKQRVAIGRALLANPRLLLMDEPLASLDEARKAEILPYIERLRDHARVPIIYVSHSMAEIARLATTMVIMEGGVVQACGATASLMQRADLAAMAGIAEPSALLEARVISHEPEFSLTTLNTGAGLLQITRPGLRADQALRLRIRASDVLISLERPEAVSALNILPAMIRAMTPAPGLGLIDLELDCAGTGLVARITAKSAQHLRLAPGAQVFAIIKSVAIE